MALHGSAAANLSPVLFKGNNSSLGVNIIIHQDDSASMSEFTNFYSNGTFVGSLQDALLSKTIGNDITRYPNLYAYFSSYSRNPSTSFSIVNPNGTLSISQAFIRGEITDSATITNWAGAKYFSNQNTNFFVNVCTDVAEQTSGVGRLFDNYSSSPSYAWRSEDVHGNLWSVFTTPNAISSAIPGRYGSVIGSDVRRGSATFIITNSDEQNSAPGDMIGQLVEVGRTSLPEAATNSLGFTARRYSGYFADNVNYTDNLVPVEGPIYRTELNQFFAGSGVSFNNTTWSITGYFLPPTSGTYTFFTRSDDASYLWVGGNAIQGYARSNAVVNNGGLHVVTERSGTIELTAGIYYPIRIIYGNQNLSGGNPTELTLSFSGPGISKRTDGAGYFFNSEPFISFERTIDGSTGEMLFREYRVIALSSYTSSDGYDGVLFYGLNSSEPYGYIKFTSNTTYTIDRSKNFPNWSKQSNQKHDTLTIASETRGGLFKISNVFSTSIDRRSAFSKCLADFIADTI